MTTSSWSVPRRTTLILAMVSSLVMAASGISAAAEARLGPPTDATPSTRPSTRSHPAFYNPPSPLPPGDPGDIIRHEPSQFFLTPLQLIALPAEAHRIMYLSTDNLGNRIAVTGTVLTPEIPWTGPGPRPIVGYAVGTQGQGDQCAPSKTLEAGLQYEAPFIESLLLQGYGVVVTDYEGLGTPGVHTYVIRQAQARALLDSIRAAQRLDVAGLPDDGPVATFGYSQGGGASAAAAELQANYAPELDFVGSYAGAVPADKGAVLKFIDGTFYFGLIGYALNGQVSAYPERIDYDRILNERGERILEEIETQCLVQTLTEYAFIESSTLTENGRPLASFLDTKPYSAITQAQLIGPRPPEAPVLVIHSVLDDVIPYPQAKEMARSWCEQGATVQFVTYTTPTHVATAAAAFPQALAYISARFAGVPAPDNCGTL